MARQETQIDDQREQHDFPKGGLLRGRSLYPGASLARRLVRLFHFGLPVWHLLSARSAVPCQYSAGVLLHSGEEEVRASASAASHPGTPQFAGVRRCASADKGKRRFIAVFNPDVANFINSQGVSIISQRNIPARSFLANRGTNRKKSASGLARPLPFKSALSSK